MLPSATNSRGVARVAHRESRMSFGPATARETTPLVLVRGRTDIVRGLIIARTSTFDNGASVVVSLVLSDGEAQVRFRVRGGRENVKTTPMMQCSVSLCFSLTLSHALTLTLPIRFQPLPLRRVHATCFVIISA